MPGELLRSVPHSVYHLDEVPGAPHLSRSLAMELLSRSPLHAWQAHPLLGGQADHDDTPASDHGSLVHGLLLGTGPEIAIAPAEYVDSKKKRTPWTDWKGGRARFRDEAHEAGKVPVTQAAWDAARRAADALEVHLFALGVDLTLCEKEATILWHEGEPVTIAPQPMRPIARREPDLEAQLRASLQGLSAVPAPELVMAPPILPASLPGVSCKARVDLLRLHGFQGQASYSVDRAQLWDLKIPDPKRRSTPHAFQRSIPFWGYDLQAFVYQRGLAAVYPELAGRIEFAFLWCETWPPFDVAVVPVSASQLAGAGARWDKAVAAWRSGLETGAWPGYGRLPAIEAPPQQLSSELAGGLSRDERIEALFGEGEEEETE